MYQDKKIAGGEVLFIDIDPVNQQQLCLHSDEAGLNPVNLSLEQYHQYQKHDSVRLIIVDAKSNGNQIISKIKNHQPLIYPQPQDYISCPLIISEVKLRIIQALHHHEINRSTSSLLEQGHSDESTGHALRHNAAALLAEATVAYLNSQLANEVNLKDLTKTMGVNRNKLTVAFKVCFGMPIFQWLREQRMLIAAKLLTTTTNSILQIAGQVGYPDSNYFSTVFKRAFGVSPQQYRKQQQQSV
ncbi:MAG: AraC-like DNA-binding protein [Alteromonadaceae bacterium]